MGKYPVYAIVALIFIGIIKLIQVTAFDAKQYEKNKKSSFSNYNTKSGKTLPKTSETKDKVGENTTDTTSIVEELPLADSTRIESNEQDSLEENQDLTVGEFESQPSGFATSENQAIYSGLEDLKNNYLAPILESLPSGQLREDVVIRYYRHEKDGNKVYVLRKLGFYIHEKEATETAGLGSNVLYYGDDVSTEDIQIVAYTLLEEGLPIKSIVPTQFSWKSTSIEVGTDTLLLDSPVLSESDIQAFNK